MEIVVRNLGETRELAGKLAKTLRGDEVLALSGSLGAGKTAFTKLLLKKIGVAKKITSPTFVLMIPYKKAEKTYSHLDLYRLNSYRDLETLGVPQSWNTKNNVFIIEWADKIKNKLPRKTIFVKFIVTGKNSRKVIIKNAPKNFKI